MKLRKNEVIECPHCGREYLPAEIFISNGFFAEDMPFAPWDFQA